MIKKYIQNIGNQSLVVKTFLLLICSSALVSCTSAKLKQSTEKVFEQLLTPSHSNHFTGFVVYDPETKDTLVAYNHKRYFIPASNTKIFTLYTALTLLPEKIPTLRYTTKGDTIWAMGTGDPAVLHPYFRDSTAINFLKSFDHIQLYLGNLKGDAFMPGWAWEDYDTYFSPERGPLPLYGNVVEISKRDSMNISPSYFKSKVSSTKFKRRRKAAANAFFVPQNLVDTLHVPFVTSDSLTLKLLGEGSGSGRVTLLQESPKIPLQTLYGIATDSILKRMMYVSDNFLAEQLMLLASSTLSDTLQFERAKAYMFEGPLRDLQQSPRWVDGSGLSRYNLFSPLSMVQVLEKLNKEYSEDDLLLFFPSWNAKGKTEETLGSRGRFLYAKGGSMGNVYNLSGYLKTASGKMLIFSYMNNNFRISVSELRSRIYQTLTTVHDQF